MSRLLSIEDKLKLQLELEDMYMLRTGIYELIQTEKRFKRERNARFRLQERVLTSGLKVIDLWEENIEMLKALHFKELELIKKKKLLKENIETREGLEADNENLRSQIHELNEKLCKCNEINENNNAKHTEMTRKFLEGRELNRELNIRVKYAHEGSAVLKTALAEGFDSLSKAIEENPVEFQEAKVFQDFRNNARKY